MGRGGQGGGITMVDSSLGIQLTHAISGIKEIFQKYIKITMPVRGVAAAQAAFELLVVQKPPGTKPLLV